MATEDKLPVAIVVCLDFSAQLELLLRRMHVWVIETPKNKRAADTLWSSDVHRKGLTELTTFRGAPANTRLGILQAVEDHHNEYTQPGPYDELIVFGRTLSPEIRTECEGFGFDQFEEREEGFRALRGSNNDLQPTK